MDDLLSDPYLLNKMRRQARDKAEARFSTTKGYQGLLEVYSSLTARVENRPVSGYKGSP
jgi:hypothetical protein